MLRGINYVVGQGACCAALHQVGLPSAMRRLLHPDRP